MDDILIKILSSNQQFHSLKDAQDCISTNDVISILSDITILDPVTITKKCTIDLGGHFMFISIPSAITIKNGVEVDFINGKIQTLASDQLEDAIIVQGSKTTVSFEPTVELSTKGTAIHVRKRGTTILNGALVSSTGTQPTIYVDDENSSLKIESGLVASYEKTAIVVRSGASLTINGGEVHTECSGLTPETTYPSVLVSGRNSNIVMNEGTIFSGKTSAVTIESSSSFELHGGEIYSNSEDYTPVDVRSPNTSFKMYGGFLHSNRTSAILSRDLDPGESHVIQMLDGKMRGFGPIVNAVGPGDHDILFSSGEIQGLLPQEYIATGYVVSDVKDSEGYSKIILKTWNDSTESTRSITSVDYESESFNLESDLELDVNSETYLDIPEQPYVDTDNTSVFLQDSLDNSLPQQHSAETLPVFHEIPPTYSGNFYPTRPHPHFHPRPVEILHNSSVNVTNKIYIYNSPSRKHVIAEWRGALRILSGGYFSYSGEEFAMVKFRVPGSGVFATGYVPVYDISDP